MRRSNPLNRRAWIAPITTFLMTVGGGGVPCSVGQVEPAEPEVVPATRPLAWHYEVLQRYRLEPTPKAILEFIDDLRGGSEIQVRIAKAIDDLGSDEFVTREKASRVLTRLSIAAERQLRAAAKSPVLEVAYRAKLILNHLDSWRTSDKQNAVLLAGLIVLREKRPKNAVPALLDLIRYLDDEFLRSAAYETIWALVSAEDEEVLRGYAKTGTPTIKAAALVGLEIVIGERAVSVVQPFLTDSVENVRLGAARALLNHRPRECVDVLADLLTARQPHIRSQAAALFQVVTGIEESTANGFPDFKAEQRKWSEVRVTHKLQVPVGEARLDATPFRSIFFESFDREMKQVESRYGLFRFETTLDEGRASVARNLLRFQGAFKTPGADGDQRLVLPATSVIGRRNLPSEFQIRTRLGGEAIGAGAYHVGVSVGNVRILFHPGHRGGGFRAERADNRQFLMQNVDMGFTPRGGVMHDMIINVRESKKHIVYFDVTVIDGTNPKNRFNRKFPISKSAIKEMDQIGLERSGRNGGMGFFGRTLITFQRAADE